MGGVRCVYGIEKESQQTASVYDALNDTNAKCNRRLMTPVVYTEAILAQRSIGLYTGLSTSYGPRQMDWIRARYTASSVCVWIYLHSLVRKDFCFCFLRKVAG